MDSRSRIICPVDLPAAQVLRLVGETPISWAVFDPVWYRQHYARELGAHIGLSAEALLQYHAETGQRLGHSPNRWFDEVWHRGAYPRIAAAVEAGHYASAFDAYCRGGSLDRSAHWLFDELGYADWQCVSADAAHEAGAINAYDHFLRGGAFDDRTGHPLFDPNVYLANFPASAAMTIRRHGPFRHYLEQLDAGGGDLRTSIYFDPDWYLCRYPEAGDTAVWKSSLHHYLTNKDPTRFDPIDGFFEQDYLMANPELEHSIVSGDFRNGYMHFLKFGAMECRSPGRSTDLVRYALRDDVKADLALGRSPHAFAHWLVYRDRPDRSVGQDPAPARSGLLPLAGRVGCSFDCQAAPRLSVVMVVRNGFELTLMAITSLRGNVSGDIELIIVDRHSSDETLCMKDFVSGARVVRFGSDISWGLAANAGCDVASASDILFLSSGTQLAPGAVERALWRLHSDGRVAAVGGLILRRGAIGQAGGIRVADGVGLDYMSGASPLAPEANFVRSVDHSSAAFIVASAEAVRRVNGFAPGCDNAWQGGVDLCGGLTRSGLSVVYDPSVVVYCDGNETAAGQILSMSGATRSLTVAARHAGAGPPRLLFIEDTVPIRRIGSGFVRSNDIVNVIVALGYQVTVYPVNGCSHHPARIFMDLPDTVEVMYDRDVDGLDKFLAERSGYYSVIWIARAHNLDRVRASLSGLRGQRDGGPFIVFDTEALAPLRQAEQARVAGTAFDVDRALRQSVANADICDVSIAVTPHEAAVLRGLGLRNVSVVGHMMAPRPTPATRAARCGLLFVGAIHTMDSPNLDGLTWFVDEVLPIIEQALGIEARLTIAGYVAEGVDLERFAGHPRLALCGMVADLEPLYYRHRVVIAPARYAAGLPYKAFEAASRGVPVVTTDLLRGQLGWLQGEEILSAPSSDPRGFARAVVAVYQQETLWQTIRNGALQRLARENGPQAYRDAIGGVLGTTRVGIPTMD